MKFKVDPDIALDPLKPEAFEMLKAEVLAEGAVVVKTWRGFYVDGYHRHRAALELGRQGIVIDVRQINLDLPDKAAAVYEARRIQMARRNATPEQERQWLGEMSEYLRSRSNGRPGVNVAEDVAKAAGVSSRTVKRASRYVRAQRKLGLTPEQAKTIDDKAIVAMADALPEEPTSEQLTQARNSLMEMGVPKTSAKAKAEPETKKAPPAPEPPASETLDARGHAVPADMVDAFLANADIDGIESAMTILTKRINAVMEAHKDVMADFASDKWLNGIRKMREALHNCRPHTVCNYCHGADDVGPGRSRCTSCGGRGWQTLSQDRMTPEELRQWQ